MTTTPPPAAQVPPVATQTPTPILTGCNDYLSRCCWNWFKMVMVFVGGIFFLLFLGGGMFFVGWKLNAPASSVMVPVVVTQPATTPPVATLVVPTPTVQPQQKSQTEQWGSYADCQRYYVLTIGRDPEGACDSLK